MSLDFNHNHFALFGFEPKFHIDTSALDTRYQTLLRELHPDRFAGATAAERRWSMQASSLVNEAQRTLKNPLARARYLLSLNGVDTGMEEDTHMAGSFLMEQMEMREALEDSDSVDALHNLKQQLRERTAQLAEAFAIASESDDWEGARMRVREWQFFEALQRDAQSRLVRLEDEA